MSNELPPEDETRLISQKRLQNRNTSDDPPRAHTNDKCPYAQKSDEMLIFEPGVTTPKVKVYGSRRNILNTRHITCPWCDWCQRHYNE